MSTDSNYHDFRRIGLTKFEFSAAGTEVLIWADEQGALSLLVVPVTGEAHRVFAATPGQFLTDFCWLRDGSVLVEADDGSECGRIRRLSPDGAWEVLTGDGVATVNIGGVSPDGQWLAYTSNARDEEALDVKLRHLATGVERDVLCDGGYYSVVGFTPAGTGLIVAASGEDDTTAILLVDLATGDAATCLTTADEGSWAPGPWLHDGRRFLCLEGESQGEWVALYTFDIQTREKRCLVAGPWDIETVAVSPDGSLLAYTRNVNGASRVYLRAVDGEAERLVESVPAGVVKCLEFTPDGESLCLLLSRPNCPMGLYTVRHTDGPLQRLWGGWDGDGPPCVEPVVVEVPATDGLTVPALVYEPARGDSPVPVLIYLHGGPASQYRFGYMGLLQWLVSRGVMVVAPNLRGSTGYGRSYERLVYRDWGGGDLRDLLAVSRFVQESLPRAGERMGLAGSSYGGFLVLSALVAAPQLWAAAVEFMGPANLVTYVQTVPPTWRRFADALIGSLEADYDRLWERSPMRRAAQIRTPLLVVAGGKDPRVPVSQSEELVAVLRQAGCAVEYALYPEEGHGFAGHANFLDAYERAFRFLMAHLGADSV